MRNGLDGINDGPDWRGPVADRLYLPSADPGRCITDAVRETFAIVNAARTLAGAEPLKPKGGARFHFEMPGSVQGFQLETSPETAGVATMSNILGHSRLGERSLAIRFKGLATGRAVRLYTPTFEPPDAINRVTGYVLVSSPTISSGQTLEIELTAGLENTTGVTCRPYISVYDANDKLGRVYGREQSLRPGERETLSWKVPATQGYPIAEAGLELLSSRCSEGVVFLDRVHWHGTPDVQLPPVKGKMWGRAWAKAIDRFSYVRDGYSMLAQDSGVGLLIQGTRDWQDYRVSASVVPSLVSSCGLCARVQGMRRYYALRIFATGEAQLTKAYDEERILGSVPFDFGFNRRYELRLDVEGSRISAWVDGIRLFDLEDEDHPLTDGAIALLVEEGCVAASDIRVGPLPARSAG